MHSPGRDATSSHFALASRIFRRLAMCRKPRSSRSRVANMVTRRRRESMNCEPRPRTIWAHAAGAKPFIAYTIASVTDHGVGDEVIYPVPGFPIYESQIVANGAVPVPIYLREGRGFAFDPAELEAKITPKTRLLILNAPQNPTDGVLDAEELDAIAEILLRHPHVWVFADEIYSRLIYEGTFDSLATRAGLLERTVISHGASKTWAMTGWRVG